MVKLKITLEEIEDMPDDFLSVDTAAEYLGKTPSTIRKSIRAGLPWGYMLGNADYQIPKQAFIHYHKYGSLNNEHQHKNIANVTAHDDLLKTSKMLMDEITKLLIFLKCNKTLELNFNTRDIDYFRQLSELSEVFKNKRLLSISDVAKYLGINNKAAQQRFAIDSKKGITTVVLARKLTD